MKLLTCFILLVSTHLLFAGPLVKPSAFADASLYLTSPGPHELAIADATVPAGFAHATAQPGLEVNSLFVSATDGAANSFATESVSGFTDQFTINAPGLTGSTGHLLFEFLVTGSLGFGGSAPGSALLYASYDFKGNGTDNTASFTEDQAGLLSGTDFLGSMQSFKVPFTFGTPFSISLALDFRGTITSFAGSGSSFVSGAFVTTSGTGGITSSFVSIPALHTASGANYSAIAVPEPSADVLLGVVALALLGRRGARFLAMARSVH